MRRLVFTIIVVGALCFVLAAKAPGELTAANARKVAPDFTLNDAKGTAVKLSDYKGKVVLLDFWGTFCEVCKVEIPWYMGITSRSFGHPGRMPLRMTSLS